MKKKTAQRYWLLVLLVCVIFPERVDASDQWQFWLDMDYGGEAKEGWSLKLKQSFQWKEDAEDFQTYFLDGSATYQVTEWLNAAAAYRHIWNRPNHNWEEEARPYADLVLKRAWHLFSFSDRNRVEWRNRENRDEEFRYRNRLTALLRQGVTALDVRPYLAAEVFLREGNADPLDADRYRVTLGMRADPEDNIAHKLPHPPAESFKTDLFFTYETTKAEEDWNGAYIVGLKLGAFF